MSRCDGTCFVHIYIWLHVCVIVYVCVCVPECGSVRVSIPGCDCDNVCAWVLVYRYQYLNGYAGMSMRVGACMSLNVSVCTIVCVSLCAYMGVN